MSEGYINVHVVDTNLLYSTISGIKICWRVHIHVVDTNLLYSTISGSQICLEGTCRISTPPYSSGFQVSL